MFDFEKLDRYDLLFCAWIGISSGLSIYLSQLWFPNLNDQQRTWWLLSYNMLLGGLWRKWRTRNQ
jgi:hypothetical protein